MKNLWQKNITFIYQKVDIYFEMVQFGTVVPKKGLLPSDSNLEVASRKYNMLHCTSTKGDNFVFHK